MSTIATGDRAARTGRSPQPTDGDHAPPPRLARLRTLPLAFRVGLALACAALLLPLIGARWAANQARSTVELQALAGQESAVSALLARIDVAHQAAVQAVQVAADDPRLAAAVAEGDAESAAASLRNLRRHGLFDRVVVGNAAGALVAADPSRGPGPMPEPPGDGTVEAAAPTVGPEGATVAVRATVRAEGAAVGQLVAAVDFEALTGGEQDLRLPGGVDVTIVDADMTILASVFGRRYEGEPVSAPEARALIASGQPGTAQYFSPRFGYEVLATYVPGSDRPWSALATSPAAEVFSASDDLRDRLLAAGIVLAVVSLAAGLFVSGYVGAAERRLRLARAHLAEQNVELTEAIAQLDAEVAARRQMIDTAADAFVSLDEAGTITGWNRQADALFGWSHEEALGRQVDQLLLPTEPDADQPDLRGLLTSEEGPILGQTMQLTARRRDGTTIPVEATIWATPSRDGWAFNAFLRDISDRLAYESVLARFEALFRSSDDAVVVLDPDGKVLDWNPAAERVYGYTREEMIGAEAAAVLAMPGQEPLAEVRCRRKDGVEIIVAVTRSPILDHDGHLVAVSSISRDVTRAKSDEWALAESEERFRLTQLNAPIGLALVGLDGRWLQVNPALCEILGREESELGGLTFQDITHRDDLDVDLEHVQRLLAGTVRSYQMDKRYLRPDDSVVWVQLNGSLVRDPRGEPQYFIAQIQDVTARRAAEERLRTQERIVHTMAEGVALSRLDDGRILFTNPQFDAMYGYEHGELIGEPFATVNAPSDRTPREAQDAVIAQLLATGSFDGELESIRKDGTQFWRRTRVSLVELEGVGLVAVSVHSDVTERREAVEALAHANLELERSNADLEDFAAVAAHDLKSPLATVGGFASLLESDMAGTLSDEGRQFAGYVVKGVHRMQTLVDDLLAYAQVGTTASRARVDLEELLEDVQDALAGDIGEAGAEIRSEGLPTVVGDRAQLRQLLMNLIANGIKFRRDDVTPVVEVVATRHGPRWIVSVADNGIGIAPGSRDRVFKMFQRLHSVSEYPGTGIGLAICKRVVENHSGAITADAGPDGGTIFRFDLPAAQDA